MLEQQNSAPHQGVDWDIPQTNVSLSSELHNYTGFGWDRVKLLHSHWYVATFWIRAEKSVDNPGMF